MKIKHTHIYHKCDHYHHCHYQVWERYYPKLWNKWKNVEASLKDALGFAQPFMECLKWSIYYLGMQKIQVGNFEHISLAHLIEK